MEGGGEVVFTNLPHLICRCTYPTQPKRFTPVNWTQAVKFSLHSTSSLMAVNSEKRESFFVRMFTEILKAKN